MHVGGQIQLKSGKSWSKNILQVTEIQPDEFIKAENLPGGLTIKVQMPFKQYGISWRLYNPLAGYKIGDAWEAIKNLDNWNEFNDARQTLNYRYHNSFKNPLNKEWHHIHERSAGGANSVENLAVTDTVNNQNFNQWFALTANWYFRNICKTVSQKSFATGTSRMGVQSNSSTWANIE